MELDSDSLAFRDVSGAAVKLSEEPFSLLVSAQLSFPKIPWNIFNSFSQRTCMRTKYPHDSIPLFDLIWCELKYS